MHENEEMYSRISKLEEADSRILLEQKEHLKNISIGLTHMGRLKAIARKQIQVKLLAENQHFKERMSKVKPYYSKKKWRNRYVALYLLCMQWPLAKKSAFSRPERVLS